jgi:hypothetical protein
MLDSHRWRSVARLFRIPGWLFEGSRSDKEFMDANGFTPMGEFNKGDVFVCGWPKSGNTWCQRLFSGLMWGLDTSVLTDQLAQFLQPDVQYKKFYYRFRTPMLFKSHLLPQPDYRKVIFLVRDGRDALVSYWKMMKQVDPDLSLEDIFDMGDELFPCSWERHAESWLQNPYEAEVMTLRYEDLLGDPVGQLSRVGAFLGITRPAEELSGIVRGAGLDNMRVIAHLHGWDNKNSPLNEAFLGQGRSGGYRSEMTAELQERYLDRAGHMLGRMGYL